MSIQEKPHATPKAAIPLRPSSQSSEFGSASKDPTGMVSTSVRAERIANARPSGGAPAGLRNPLGGRALRDYIEIPFAHWPLITLFLLLGVATSILALILWPRSYESQAKLMIQVGRESVALDPTATTSQTLMLQKTQEEEVNSALEVLSSRQVAEMVVDLLGAEPILNGELTVEDVGPVTPSLKDQIKHQLSLLSDAVDRTLLQVGIKDAISSRERAVRKVTQSVGIYAPKKSTAVTIHANAKTPQMAQALVSATTQAFLDRHLTVNRTEGSLAFFQEQSAQAEIKLTELLKRRSEFMQEMKVVSADDKRRILTDQLGAIEQTRFQTRGELEQALAEIEDIQHQVQATPAEIVAATQEQTDLTWSGIRQRLNELELQEQQLLSLYSKNNPKVVSVREQLEGAREILQKLSKESKSSQTTPNPVRIRLEEELQKLETRVVGLRSMLAEKDKQQIEIEDEINSLLVFELKLAEMNRAISIVENSLGMLKSKLEEARVIAELQTDNISNVSVYQPASFVERPASPSKPLLAVAFPMLGIICGLGLALIRETGNTRLRTAAQVEEKLGSAPLVCVPFHRTLKHVEKLVKKGRASSVHSQCMQMLSEAMLSTPAESSMRGKTIGVLGVEDGCGASTLAAALAITATRECGLQTVLIDADMHRATSTKTFGLKPTPGLAELLSGNGETSECIQQLADDVRLEFVSAAMDAQAGRVDFNANVFGSLLSEFQFDNDLVILDLPSASRPEKAHAIIPRLDFLFLVVESNKTEESLAERLVLRYGRAPLRVVLNKTRDYLPRIVSQLLS